MREESKTRSVPQPGAGRLILVLGGARSGKSTFAQSRAGDIARREGRSVVYIATAQAGDGEMSRRIAAHRRSRPEDWRTVEEPIRVSEAVKAHCGGRCVAVVDCMTLLVSNIVAKRCAVGPEAENIPESEEAAAQAEVDAETGAIVKAARSADCAAVIVSNEVGLGVVPQTPLGRLFRDAAGRANQRLAREADEVFFMVAGIAQKIK